MARRRLIITGRVQGVGYREALRAEAERLGVTGGVRNLRDGSVEAVLEGSDAAVEAVITWARRGPPAARVAGIAVGAPPAPLDRPYSCFERWPSA